jgi:hypothetical protein
MATINFTKSFQFTVDKGNRSEIFTYEGIDLEGNAVILWRYGNHITYRLSAVREFIDVGAWVMVAPKPSLRSLYETERDKLTAQQDITTAAWELVVAEKAMEDNARKALLHAKQDLVDRARDTLKEASEFYLKISAELDEMLRNEPL